MEIWKSITGYEGFYEVSSFGNVRSKKRKGTAGKMLAPKTNKYGYLEVVLSLNCKTKTFKVHRLVAVAFIGNDLGKPEVNHINGIKNDNKAENLEWCTSSENMSHASRTGLLMSNSGEMHCNSALTKCDVIYIYNVKNLTRILQTNIMLDARRFMI